MKNFLLVSTFLLLLTAAVCKASAQAATGPTNAFPAVVVNGTNNGSAFFVANVQIPLPYLTYLSGAITNVPVYVTNVTYGVTNVINTVTNTIAYNVQYSVDPNNSNWVTAFTWFPTSTNGAIDSPTPGVATVTLPLRIQVATTNAQPVQAVKTR